jgi:hypothetical protein
VVFEDEVDCIILKQSIREGGGGHAFTGSFALKFSQDKFGSP